MDTVCLAIRYECHINVEVCTSVQTVKYLYKYVHKPKDRAMVRVAEEDKYDEVKKYQDARSFGTSEACWRTYNFRMYQMRPSVMPLSVHAPGMVRVTYAQGDELKAVQAGCPDTTLSKWFEYIHDPPLSDSYARNTTYMDFPATHVFVKANKKKNLECSWKERENIAKKGYDVIGRLYTIHPSAGDTFYLRMLLTRLTGQELDLSNASDAKTRAKSYTFDALLHVQSSIIGEYTVCESYREACEYRGLLATDSEWTSVLQDAVHNVTKISNIRELFVTLLTHCTISNPSALFKKFALSMGIDFARNLQTNLILMDNNVVRGLVLLDIEKRLFDFGFTLSKYNLLLSAEIRKRGTTVLGLCDKNQEPRLIQYQLDVNHKTQADIYARTIMCAKLSQRTVLEAIISDIDTGTPRCYFIDAPGGTGKTFCNNGLLAYVRKSGQVALAVASSGIASLLLDLGTTFHSRFKASLEPFEVTAGYTLNIPAQSGHAKLIRRATIIVCDEAPMTHRYVQIIFCNHNLCEPNRKD
jgi:hypothetical protein